VDIAWVRIARIRVNEATAEIGLDVRERLRMYAGVPVYELKR